MNKYKLDIFIETAVNLKIATLKAKEQKIIDYMDRLDQFHLSDEEVFKSLVKMGSGTDYNIKDTQSNWKYEYSTTIEGLNFFVLTKHLLFDGDENKVESEVE